MFRFVQSSRYFYTSSLRACLLTRNQGFTYLSLIIFLTVISIFSAASLQLGHIMMRRAAEQELLAIGAEFRSALASYAAATPEGQVSVPQSLQDLLKDSRYPNTRRHLRKIYVDPISGKEEWGTMIAFGVGGRSVAGIVGVYSLSSDVPIKIGNFDEPFRSFEGKKSYQDWKFVFLQGTN